MVWKNSLIQYTIIVQIFFQYIHTSFIVSSLILEGLVVLNRLRSLPSDRVRPISLLASLAWYKDFSSWKCPSSIIWSPVMKLESDLLLSFGIVCFISTHTKMWIYFTRKKIFYIWKTRSFNQHNTDPKS